MINDTLKGHFLNLYLMALCDSSFDETELEIILKIGEEKGISQKEFEDIIINPSSIEISYPRDFLGKIKFLYDFTRVIWADKKIQNDEEQAFLKFGERFGFSQTESQDLFTYLIDLAKKNISSSEIETEILKITQ